MCNPIQFSYAESMNEFKFLMFDSRFRDDSNIHSFVAAHVTKVMDIKGQVFTRVLLFTLNFTLLCFVRAKK